MRPAESASSPAAPAEHAVQNANAGSPISIELPAFAIQKRRERDSNPRNGCPFTRFPVAFLRPLGHLSGEVVTLAHFPTFFASTWTQPVPSCFVLQGGPAHRLTHAAKAAASRKYRGLNRKWSGGKPPDSCEFLAVCPSTGMPRLHDRTSALHYRCDDGLSILP